MDIEEIIKSSIGENLGLSVLKITEVGRGASGFVYKAETDGSPNMIAVKISEHPKLMQQEYEMLSLLKEKTRSKIPNVYSFSEKQGKGIILMEYISGICGGEKALKYKFNKKHLAESIIDNLLVIEEAHNDKFGPYNNAVYETWEEYYREFAGDIYEFAQEKYREKKLDEIVFRAIELSYKNFDEILSEKVSTPTLIHGDYWMPNFIIDKKSMELLSVIDPFNVMWADPEYELFALTAGYGEKLRLYDLYKKRVKVSRYCDVKIRMYALYSEMLWYKTGVQIEHSFLRKLAKKLIKQMKKHRVTK